MAKVIEKLKILCVEDSENDFVLLTSELENQNLAFEAQRVESLQDFMRALRNHWDVVLCDHRMNGFSSIEALDYLHSKQIDLPFILVSGVIGEEQAVESMRAGAHDFVMKNNLKRLGPAIHREVFQAKKRAEARDSLHRLEESERRFRTMADAAPVFIWTSDQFGSRDFFSRPWLDFTGQALNTELGEAWIRHVAEDDRAQLKQVIEEARLASKSYEVEYRLRRNDGNLRWILERGTPRINERDQLLGYVGSCLDITERKEVESEKAKAYEMAQRASRMKDDFLATLSHELRTPLNSIMGHSELLLSETPGSTEFYESVDAIYRNGVSQLQIVNDLLDISKITGGNIALKIEAFPLLELLDEVVESLDFMALAKQIQVQKDYTFEPGPMRGDRERLRQVFWNLLANSIKFTPPGGVARLRVELQASQICVTVADTGRGIEPDFLPEIFDTFRQEDVGATREFGGLGLGLAITKYIVELHGGAIKAKSEGRNRGAQFTVELPLPSNDSRA